VEVTDGVRIGDAETKVSRGCMPVLVARNDEVPQALYRRGTLGAHLSPSLCD
jgi:hypothetical protein